MDGSQNSTGSRNQKSEMVKKDSTQRMETNKKQPSDNTLMRSDTGICNGHIHVYNEINSPAGTNHYSHWCDTCGLSFENSKVKTHDVMDNHVWIFNYDGKTKDCLGCGVRNEPI